MAKNVLFKDLKIGNWTLIEKQDKKWLCRCSCGSAKSIASSSLTSRASLSCGCLRKQLLSTNNPMFNADTAALVGKKVSLAMTEDRRASNIIAMNSEKAKAKRAATNISRYGGISPASSLDVQKKMASTNMLRFGVTAAAQSVVIKEKTKQYFQDTYGVDNPMKLDIYKQKVSIAVSASRRSKDIELLPNGSIAVDECRLQGVLPTTYRNWRRTLGAEDAQSKLYGDRLTFRSLLEKNMLEILAPLSLRGVTVESWNKKAHPDLRYKPDIKLSFDNKEIFLDVDGLYWHSSDSDDNDTDYHMVKAEEFMKLGITLLQFREDEVYDKPQILFSMIEHRLGLSTIKCGARDLTLLDVDRSAANTFLEDNHLMGPIEGVRNIGLFADKELVALLSYKLENNQTKLDISRFCVKCGVTVNGAFSRLISKIEKIHLSVDEIQNFVDLRYSSGFSSIKTGFILDTAHLSWKWTDGKSTFNRRYCKADKVLGLSEVENAKRLKLSKIYDAGQLKLIKKIDRNTSGEKE